MSSRPVLFRALLQRELTLAFALIAALTAACAAWLGGLVVSDLGAGPAAVALPRLLRRADLLLLGIAALLSALRVTQLIADDRTSGWLEPYVASGRSAHEYSLALVGAVLLARYVWFAAAAIAFAGGIYAASGSTELAAELPLVLGGGLIVMAGITAYAAVFGVLVRDAIAAFMLAAIVCAVPLGVAAIFIARELDIPLLLRASLIVVAPPVSIPGSLRSAWLFTAYIPLALLVLALLSQRRIGRRA